MRRDILYWNEKINCLKKSLRRPQIKKEEDQANDWNEWDEPEGRTTGTLVASQIWNIPRRAAAAEIEMTCLFWQVEKPHLGKASESQSWFNEATLSRVVAENALLFSERFIRFP